MKTFEAFRTNLESTFTPPMLSKSVELAEMNLALKPFDQANLAGRAWPGGGSFASEAKWTCVLRDVCRSPTSLGYGWQCQTADDRFIPSRGGAGSLATSASLGQNGQRVGQTPTVPRGIRIWHLDGGQSLPLELC